MKKKQDPNRPPATWQVPEPAKSEPGTMPDLSRHLMDLHRTLYLADAGDRASEQGWQAYLQASALQYQEYLRELVRRSDDLMTHQELSGLDMIDAYQLEDAPWPGGLFPEFLPYAGTLEHPVYAFLPCFPKGVFLLPKVEGTIPNYAQYEVLDLDESAETFTLRIRDYCIASNRFEPGIGCTARIDANPCRGQSGTDLPRLPRIDVDVTKNVSFVDMYTRILPRDMHWTRDQARRWRRTILQNAVDQYARFEDLGADIFKQLVQRFLAGTLAVNASLSSARPAVLRNADPDKLLGQPDGTPEKPEKPGKTQDSDTDQAVRTKVPTPPRRVRSVGLVKFTSERPPRAASKTARNYKLASWTARGHMRHYKSGKQVYIKATVRHRRKAVTEHDPAPSTIRLRDNRPDKDGKKGGNT